MRRKIIDDENIWMIFLKLNWFYYDPSRRVATFSIDVDVTCSPDKVTPFIFREHSL